MAKIQQKQLRASGEGPCCTGLRPGSSSWAPWVGAAWLCLGWGLGAERPSLLTQPSLPSLQMNAGSHEDPQCWSNIVMGFNKRFYQL